MVVLFTLNRRAAFPKRNKKKDEKRKMKDQKKEKS